MKLRVKPNQTTMKFNPAINLPAAELTPVFHTVDKKVVEDPKVAQKGLFLLSPGLSHKGTRAAFHDTSEGVRAGEHQVKRVAHETGGKGGVRGGGRRLEGVWRRALGGRDCLR